MTTSDATQPASSATDFWAYVLPYVVLLLAASLAAHVPPAWYPLWYAATTALVLAVWIAFQRRYPAFSTQGWALGLAAGVVGVVVWISLSLPQWEEQLLGWVPEALYSGERVGYDPFEKIASAELRYAFIAVRLLGLAVVVPLAEEVFWRGFLLRYLVSENWREVPLGAYTPLSFAAVTLLFALTHVELLAAVVWGAAINLLLYRTKNLWACILMHAVTNLLLGIYILQTGAWELW